MDSVQQALREDIASMIGISIHEVDPAANLVDLGLDSLMLVELLFRLEQRYDVQIDAADLLGHPTIESLASAITRLNENNG